MKISVRQKPIFPEEFSQLPVNQTATLEVSIVIPCLNEAETIAICIEKARCFLYEQHIAGEVVVADNGSTDGSQEISSRMGARVVQVQGKGYGSALMGGITAAYGQFIIMGDADDSYDFSTLLPFIEKLRDGYDLVMGNRFAGGIKPGAMPFSHRYLGNPILTWLGRLFFSSPCGDFYCGLRGFRKDAFVRMDLRTTGMEFASEMVVKAALLRMRITEVATTLSPDGRSRPPHLRTWRDGWRGLRFLLLYSPKWLFFYPGVLLMLTGLLTSLWLFAGPQVVGRVTLDVHSLLYAATAVLLGFQAVTFAAFTKLFAVSEGLLPTDPLLDTLFRVITLEVGLVIGAFLILIGLGGSLYALGIWGSYHFGPLDTSKTMRMVIPSTVSLTLGCQIIFSSFFLSVLGLNRK
jgi:glycosyltransferase involved in cell wall biosynthesis